MSTNPNPDPSPRASSLTKAMIGTGFAAAMAGLEYEPAVIYGSYAGMLACVVAHADALHVEWSRRYGRDSQAPYGYDMDVLQRLARRFGLNYATALTKDPGSRPEPVIQALFKELENGSPKPVRIRKDSALAVVADFKGDMGEQIWRMGLFDNEEDARVEWEAYSRAIAPDATLLRFIEVTI